MKILIVDDKLEARYMLEIILKSREYETLSAVNGREALGILAKNQVDLIISDILMPEMDGFQFCLAVKQDERFKQIPFVFYTATYVDSKDKEFALGLGANLFLIKPMQPDKLLIEIETLMDKLKQGEAEIQNPKWQDEKVIYKLYNERLVNKLEKKIQELEKEISERRQAEEALQESERRFQVLAEYSPVGIFRTDAQGSTTYVNPRWCKISGLSAGEALGGGWLMAVHPEDREKISADWKQATESQHPSVSEYRFVHKDGSIVWVMGQAVPERNAQDQIIGYVGTITNITERKKAEAALKSSEERLNILFEFAPDAYYLTDLKGVFIDGNKAAEDITGYKREELIGKSFIKLGLLSANELMKTSKLLMKNVQGRGSGPDELVLNKKNGDKVTVEIRTYPVKIHNKTVVLGIARDITERKRAEKEYKQLIDGMNETAFVIDFNGRFAEVNKTAVEMLGYSRNELLKMGPTDIDPNLSSNDISKLIEGMKTDQVQIFETKHRAKDGRIFPMEISSSIINYRGKRAILSIARDITERKKAEEQIQNDLREKTALIQELYHRTKNNMQVIVSMLKMHSRVSGSDSLKTAYQEMINKINSMSLVHQKLYETKDLSRINLKNYIQDLVYLLRQSYSLQAQRISLHFHLADVFVMIDSAVPLGLVLNELVSNAFKHAFPDGRTGRIAIRLLQDDNGQIHIHLADDGIGIPAGKDLRKGNSMGLNIMFTLIDYQLRGEVDYHSENGLRWHIKYEDTSHKRRV